MIYLLNTKKAGYFTKKMQPEMDKIISINCLLNFNLTIEFIFYSFY